MLRFVQCPGISIGNRLLLKGAENNKVDGSRGRIEDGKYMF